MKFPFALPGIGAGTELPSVILCDACRKPISVTGIHPEILHAGEYEISYFSCVHCGRRYQITTTDQQQRDLIRKHSGIGMKIRAAHGKNFRPETVTQYRKEWNRLGETLERRAAVLRKTGEEILSAPGIR